MAVLYAVRHGQASFGAANYDQLSSMGWQQARWLGQWFAEQQIQFDRIALGTLVRHQETLAGILEGMGTTAPTQPPLVLPGLDEYHSEVMLREHLGQLPQFDLAQDRRIYFRQLREALYSWASGEMSPPNYPSYAQFRQGVVAALVQATATGAKSVLLVSSGGPISNMVGHVLQTPGPVTVDINLQTRNSSVSQFAFNEQGTSLMSFNTIAHLQGPMREGGVTYS